MNVVDWWTGDGFRREKRRGEQRLTVQEEKCKERRRWDSGGGA